jgi:glycosyltransferase involved in cell wall biosynthesis
LPPPTMPFQPVQLLYAFLDLQDGGAQRLTLAACRHLDRERFHPGVLCLRGGGALVSAAVRQGLPVHELHRLCRRRDWRAVPATARWLRAVGAQIVHVALYSRASPYARAAVAHEWCRPRPPAPARRLADRVLRPGTVFVAASQALRAELLASGLPEERVALVYSGIQTEAFAPGDRAAARAAAGLPPGRPMVLVPARLHPMKGHVDLLAALPYVRRRVPGVLVLCAGDGPLRDALPALAAAAGLDEHVVFAGQRHDMDRLLAACDVVALPSRVEGLPSAMLEALCAARPVVAAAVGGVPEVMAGGVGGWTVPPRSPDALAEALVSALSAPAEAAARARSGRAVVLERFRADQAARRLEAVYEHWLTRPAARPATETSPP